MRRVADIFLVDHERRLTGRVALQALALAPPGTLLESLAAPPVSVSAIDPQEDDRLDTAAFKALLRAAIASPDPVVVLEPKKLSWSKGEVDTSVTTDLSSARVLRQNPPAPSDDEEPA